MITTNVKDGKTYASINDLKEWDKNPRDIKPEDFERLKTQLTELGQYKPLLVMEDGTVLGGNMRLKAYKAMGQLTELWVSIVTPANEKEKLRFALSDNDNVGYYVEDKLLAVIKEAEFTIEESAMFKIDLSAPVPIDKLLNKELSQASNSEVSIADITKQFNCACPKCGFEFNFKFKKESDA